MAVFKIWKPVGLTPLEAVKRLQQIRPDLGGVKLTYAGRLDPLALGVMIILSAGDIKDKEQFLVLPKTYEVEILLGAATDSGDVLGLSTKVVKPEIVSLERVAMATRSLVGKRRQTAPRYSAPGLDGKVFTRSVEIKSVAVGERQMILAEALLKLIEEKIFLVMGDFRQAEILAGWQRELKRWSSCNFPVIPLTIECSSGTYVRLLARELGRQLELPALALHIKRIKVGEITESDCVKV
ncbi:MAG: hypothetical protein A2589_03110 [Candidatus Vogelbacteria bacterium RIFOXYD1_FULL_46_19]|uniref:tRNA pseudouridine(55) synthase n=1 Tax=Candidatus Vogelbacteria bacterium RIFOXYD1_FULL_46_19 TaxID=1802439 RepID=A0A1G2QGP2_9BACT|nr:MAG: hypothetical protein A2589_03110 [Candidatus Vogelbacteria bacterium RIFOXYD1_FULL_46_19]